MENRLRILAEDYRDRYGEEPIHHIQTRIKTKESIEGKLTRRNRELTAEDARDYLRDIAGIRVICYDVDGIRKLAKALKRQGDLEIVREKDYISAPKPNGYKSYHLVTGVPIYRVDGMAMDLWASLEHRSCYKRKEEDKQAWSARFLKYSRILEQMEQAVADYGRGTVPDPPETGAQGSRIG